jgi:hypothetical protein
MNMSRIPDIIFVTWNQSTHPRPVCIVGEI